MVDSHNGLKSHSRL